MEKNPNDNKLKPLSVRVPIFLHKEIWAEAQQENRSFSRQINEIFLRYFNYKIK